MSALEMLSQQEPVSLLHDSDAFLTIWLSSSAPQPMGMLKLSDGLSCPAFSDLVETTLEMELFFSFEQWEI